MLPFYNTLSYQGGDSAPTTDLYFSSVVLLLGGDGTNGSTTLVDESSSAKTQTATSTNAINSTENPKFGAGSIKFLNSGSGLKIRYADHADWDFGSGDWTIEFWIYFNGAGVSNADMVAQWATNGTQAWWFHLEGGNLKFDYRNNADSTNYTAVSGAWAPAQSTWYHVCAERSGNTWRVYVDGVVKASATVTNTIKNGTAQMRVGYRDGGGTVYEVDGFMDEVRITKGVGRYGGAFTPPIAAFPRS